MSNQVEGIEQTKRRPYDATCLDDMASIESDNFDSGKFWILADGETVTVARGSDDTPTEMMTIPRKNFNALIDWYMAAQVVKNESA